MDTYGTYSRGSRLHKHICLCVLNRKKRNGHKGLGLVGLVTFGIFFKKNFLPWLKVGK